MPCCSTARFTGCTTRAGCSPGAIEGKLPRTCCQRVARHLPRSTAKRRSSRHCANWPSFSRSRRGETRESCADQGGARDVRRASRNRCARPSSHSPWPNCFLAGDWIGTGWPSTMESAARSGHLAAEAFDRCGRRTRSLSGSRSEADRIDALVQVLAQNRALMVADSLVFQCARKYTPMQTSTPRSSAAGRHSLSGRAWPRSRWSPASARPMRAPPGSGSDDSARRAARKTRARESPRRRRTADR